MYGVNVQLLNGELGDISGLVCAQSCPTLCDPVDCSPPGFSVREIFQARILEWVAIPFTNGTFTKQLLNIFGEQEVLAQVQQRGFLKPAIGACSEVLLLPSKVFSISAKPYYACKCTARLCQIRVCQMFPYLEENMYFFPVSFQGYF